MLLRKPSAKGNAMDKWEKAQMSYNASLALGFIDPPKADVSFQLGAERAKEFAFFIITEKIEFKALAEDLGLRLKGKVELIQRKGRDGRWVSTIHSANAVMINFPGILGRRSFNCFALELDRHRAFVQRASQLKYLVRFTPLGTRDPFSHVINGVLAEGDDVKEYSEERD